MMEEKNIALIGFMGAGKTAVSQILAKRLKRQRVSVDDLIVKLDGREINAIFSESGEKFFRDLESCVIAEAVKQNGLVIDCGGGAVLKEENVANLKSDGVIVYLKASLDAVYGRVKNQKHRPLLNVEDPRKRIGEMLQVRAPVYEQACDVCIVTDQKRPEDVADEIVRVLGLR